MIVFVLHPDLDVLAAIVGKMRARGLETLHAAEAAPLIERAAKTPPTVLVIPERSEDVEGAAELAALRGALPDVPEVMIPPLLASDEARVARLVDVVTSAIAAAAPADQPQQATGEVRGDLAQVPLPDLLQLLSMGKKTGTLTVTTSSAAGELRLADGEVVDAMFRRADGMKAVVRLLGERDGAFHFAPDATPGLRRIREPISTILMEGTRQTDEIRRLREQLGLGGPAQVVLAIQQPTALATGALPPKIADDDTLAHEVAALLATPRTLDDLLDELPSTDLELLSALLRLHETGSVRQLPIGDLRPSLAGPEGMVVLRGLARRLRPRGYRGQGRLVIVGHQASVRLARSSISRLAEAMPGADGAGDFSAERAIESTALLQLGESIGLDVVTIVDRADLAPSLPLVLNGAIAVIALDRPSASFAQVVEELEVALVDARSVCEDHEGGMDPGDPSSMAAVVRGAIEGMGGS